MTLAAAFVCILLTVDKSLCQTFITGYPLGPETAWTRYTWPSVALKFPYDRVLDWTQQDRHALLSASGPRSLVQYEKESEEQSPRYEPSCIILRQQQSILEELCPKVTLEARVA